MHPTESAKFANMVMVCDGSRILVENRTDPDWPGLVCPGGHVEPGESFVSAAVREVEEETGLTVRDLRLCGVKQWFEPEKNFRYVVFLYRTDSFSGELRSSDEGEVFWLEREELKTRPLASGFVEMLEVFERDDVTEDYLYPDGADGAWKHALR